MNYELVEWLRCRVCGNEHPGYQLRVDGIAIDCLGATRCYECWTRLIEDDGHTHRGKKGRLCNACATSTVRWHFADNDLKLRRHAALADVRVGVTIQEARKALREARR